MSEVPSSDPRLQAWFDAVDRHWQHQGIAAPDRARLRVEAETDFTQSLADGAHISDLISTDPAKFAREVAAADGLTPSPEDAAPALTTRTLIVTALTGAAIGAVLCWTVLYQVLYLLMSLVVLPPGPEGLFALGVHSVAAIACTLVSVAFVRWRFRHLPGIRRTAALTGIGLLLGGGVSVAPAMALAATLGYSTSPGPVAVVALVVAVCCGAGVATAVRLNTYLGRVAAPRLR